jgi:hypothetical protein
MPKHLGIARTLSRLVGAGLSALLVSCGSLSQPPLDRACFEIDPGQPAVTVSRAAAVASTQADPATLQIRRLHVDGPYDGIAFVYRDGANQCRTDYYNNFITPPDQMLTSAVRNWLAQSSRFRFVVSADSEAAGPYALEGTVTALYGDFADKAAPRAVMTIRLELLDPSSKIVFQKEYAATSSIEPGSAQKLVEGWDTDLRDILLKVATDLHG